MVKIKKLQLDFRENYMKMYLLLFLSLFIAGFGCKPNSHSTAKSLDNFNKVKSHVSHNICTGKFANSKGYRNGINLDKKLKISHEKAQKVRDLVLRALTAIPKRIKDLFFKKARIKLVKSPECSFPTETSQSQFREESPDGCWDKTALKEHKIIALLKLDPDAIEHTTVRLIGLFYADLLKGHYDQTDTSRASLFGALKQSLPSAFFMDLNSQGQDPKPLSDYYNQLQGFDKEQFERSLLADAFDSQYCNDQTREVFEQKFKNTNLVYHGRPDVIAKLISKRKDSRGGFQLQAFRPVPLPKVDPGAVQGWGSAFNVFFPELDPYKIWDSYNGYKGINQRDSEWYRRNYQPTSADISAPTSNFDDSKATFENSLQFGWGDVPDGKMEPQDDSSTGPNNAEDWIGPFESAPQIDILGNLGSGNSGE
jgi:hypothetical protein